MNPFQNIRKWTRKEFTPPPTGADLERRKLAEIETDRDLQKPVQQLLCDVHDESLAGIPDNAPTDVKIVFQLQRLTGAQKRMVSLQAVSAFQSSRTNSLVFWLTLIIVLQTCLLLWLTFFPRQSSAPSSPHAPLIVNPGTKK
jgi:hypothetical protein